jgi:antitoxin component YwqK of YwqJK toxin-antitoxin module
MGNNTTIKAIFSLLFLSCITAGYSNELPIVLKKKEANWRPVTQETFSDGSPKIMLFYEPKKGEEGEIPVKIIEFYPNGKIHVETDIKNENGALIPEGASATYTLDGTLHIYATYVNGKLHGTINIFSPEGTLNTSYKIRHGILEGTKTAYHDNGAIKEIANYIAGNLHGKVERFYDDGTKEALLNYENGILDGDVIIWNPDGSVKEKYIYLSGVQHNGQKIPIYDPTLIPLKPLPEENIKTTQNIPAETLKSETLDGEYIVYREDGSIEKRLNYRMGKPHGEQISYHPNGNQEALLTYTDGILNGKKTLLDESGQVLEEAFYKNGDLEGRYFVCRPNGQEVISHYRNNRLYGLYQVFYPPHPIFGKMKAFEATYENGLVEGEVSEFNEAGTKITSTFYKKGKKDGIATFYYKDGKVRITAEFKNDLQDGMTYEYFPSGTIAKQAMFRYGIRDGEEKTFYENGELKTHYSVSNDQLNGVGKEWNSRGILIFEGRYINGKKEGTFKKYDDFGMIVSEKVYSNDEVKEKKR